MKNPYFGRLLTAMVTPFNADGSVNYEKAADLADAGISVGCLNLSESNAMFAVFADDVEHTNKVLNGTDFEYTLTEDCAKVSVVGSAMRGVPGVMANFVAALTGCKISILQTVDSDTTISAIIKQEHLIDALKALHKAFKL